MSNINYSPSMVRAWFNPETRHFEMFDLSGNPIPFICEGVVIKANNYDALAPIATLSVFVDIVNERPKGKTQPVSKPDYLFT